MIRDRVLFPFTLAIIAAIHSPANACATYSAADIASAVANSPYASQAVKNASCTWGGAGKANHPETPARQRQAAALLASSK